MKTIYTIVLILLSNFTYSQTFIFDMYFEDALGNKDTLTMGYDPLATDGIDASFGEVNIISVPLNSNLDVRISDEYVLNGSTIGAQTYHTKKNIVLNNYCSDINVFNLNIKTDNWPVTATWDSTLFNTNCVSGGAFSSMLQWWDVPGLSDLNWLLLKGTDSIVFSANEGTDYFNENCSFINSANDTVSVFQIILSDPVYISVSIDESNLSNNSVYPNPFNNEVIFLTNTNTSKVIIYNSIGEEVYSKDLVKVTKLRIDTAHLKNGIYFYKFINTDGSQKSGKLIKD